MKYPIGIQSFEKIRKEGYLYVDKTDIIYDLINSGSYFFLSRPRRFGKSLLMSTIEAIFRGERELFEGLALADSDWDWKSHEVIHIDFNGENYQDKDTLKAVINGLLSKFEVKYGITCHAETFGLRFRDIIQTAANKSGNGVVVLIDEYDKPILDALYEEEIREYNKNTLQAFYSVLKSMDQYIRFAMLTGISKFSKVSILSGLNNLNDISLSNHYNSLCGISETELTDYFHDGIKDIGESKHLTSDEVHSELKKNYDGYHFSREGIDIYNPFSLLNAFANKEISDYWYATGTPSSLIKLIEKRNFPIPELDSYKCPEDLLTGSDIYLTDPIPLLFQSGYLTIKDYDNRFKLFTLGLPNDEVSHGFYNQLMKTFTRGINGSAFIAQFITDVENGKALDFMDKLKSFFADFPYDHVKLSKKVPNVDFNGALEIHYQNIIFVIMKLMGFYAHTEYRTSNGRIDMIIETLKYLYVIEFNIDSSAEDALRQIEAKDYALPFKYGKEKKIIKIGANFDSKKKQLSDYVISE